MSHQALTTSPVEDTTFSAGRLHRLSSRPTFLLPNGNTPTWVKRRQMSLLQIRYQIPMNS